MEIVSFKAETRKEIGAKAAKASRKAGQIPCVIYGNGEAVYFTALQSQVKAIVYTPDFKLASITVDGVENKCILKDIQLHPVTDAIVHIDFLRLKEGVPVKVEIPIAFKGVSPGVKGGGTLVQTMRKVKIKVDPSKLMDKLFVSIDGLELNHSVRVKDLEIEEGVEFLSPISTPVAQVVVPRALKSVTAADEEEDEEGVEVVSEVED